jgi:hypothetical protein
LAVFLKWVTAHSLRNSRARDADVDVCGRVMVNKKTWYAHLWKKERGYSLPSGEQSRGALWSCDFWINDRWHLKKYNFSRLIDKFNPPGWPADWRDCRDRLLELPESRNLS